jgi:hydroxyacid-oxoacid transhydrogenase
MGADLTDTEVEDGGDILADQIIGMMRETGIPNGLSGVGYSMDDLDALTNRSYAQKRLIDNGPPCLFHVTNLRGFPGCNELLVEVEI